MKECRKIKASLPPSTFETSLEPAYKTVQSKGKALKRLIQKLPKSPRKQREIICSLANSRGIKVVCEKESSQIRTNSFPGGVIERVRDFFFREDISRCSPNRKDSISVKVPTGKRERLQKHILFSTLKEAYTQFVQENEDVKVGFTKFTQLRPLNILPASNKDQSVCCCPYCENMKLLLKVPWIKPNWSKKLMDFVGLFHCDVTSADCMHGRCEGCCDKGKKVETLSGLLHGEDSTLASYIIYSWRKGVLESKEIIRSTWIQEVLSSLSSISSHLFNVHHQKKVLREQLATLTPHTCVLQVDFAENFQIRQKDEVMAAHWVNDPSSQVTIYTCMAHIGTSDGTVKLPIAMISDATAHSSVEVDVFNRKIIKYLSEKYGVDRLHMWSDGAAQHFKNFKTMSLFSLYTSEFHLQFVDWHFQVSLFHVRFLTLLKIRCTML